MIFKNKEAEFAFIVSVIFILLSGAILVFGVGDGEAPVGCFSCIFVSEQKEQGVNEAAQFNATEQIEDYNQIKGD